MESFTQIAIPHEDIVKGKLTMDVFAADLWQVAKGKAIIDYQDPSLFFKKTYITEGLKHILNIAKERFESKVGDSVIQLQTLFGGGKTHTLIALYHKAKEWGAKTVILDGTALNPKEKKFWEELEYQLTGKIEITKGEISPGKEAITKILSENSPVLILMDEVLEYATKAAGVKIGASNLAAQTLAFIQELTGAVSIVGNSLLVFTLPSSTLEHYDENSEKMFQQLQKITGRTEKIYTPVKDDEIEEIIRKRLFQEIKNEESKKIIDNFIEHLKKENLLLENEILEYRNRFLKSYPFKPEVIDVLYKRWGSFPTFQRTRGILRLLSIVIHDLLDKKLNFIRLGDFNLDNQEIRRELIKHIGQEWDSIIAQDITTKSSGAKKVDELLGSSYLSYKLGTIVSTTIFMTSHSGIGEKSISTKEIKIYTTEPSFSSSVIDTVINNLKEKLFYLSDEGLFFTNQPNLNKIILSTEDNVQQNEIYEEEVRIIKQHISKDKKFKIYIHPKFSKEIDDNLELKLLILNSTEPDKEFLENHGEKPRIYKNTMIFLCIDIEKKEAFYSYLRKLIALKKLSQDKKINLSDSQKNDLKNKLKNQESKEYEELRRFYRKVFLPTKDGFKEIEIGVPTFGESEIDKEIYNYLRNQGEIIEKIASKVIKDRYLSEKEFIEIKNLYETLLKTPGELRITSEKSFIDGIKEGVENGLFGFGYLENDKPTCKTIKKTPKIDFNNNEIIIKANLCQEETDKETYQETYQDKELIQDDKNETKDLKKIPTLFTDINKKERKEETTVITKTNIKEKINLKLDVPPGKLSIIARILNYLKEKFKECDVEVLIKASKGEITKSEYEDKIIEALTQEEIKFEELQ